MKNYSNKYDDCKIGTFPLNNTINAINCYKRPHINSFISRKNIKSKNKKSVKKININLRKTKGKDFYQFKPKIESRYIKFYKNNSSEKILNYSDKENLSPNILNNKTNSLFNSNKINSQSTCPSIERFKMKNFDKIKENNNDLKDKTFKEYQISKDIAILCKIINSINYTYNNEFEKNINNKKIKKFNSTKNFNINGLVIKTIIKIQKWWKNMLYHLYIEKYIILIQKRLRQYLKKKKYIDYKNKSNLKKIIIIQKSWKNYMKNKYLNDYYYFSFKKYIKPNKENKLANISKSNLKNYMKINNNNIHSNIIKYNYFTKTYFQMNKINDINNKIIKIQKIFRNNNKLKKLIIKLPKKNKCFCIKQSKNKNFIINKKLILKISKIQKNIRKFLSIKQDKMSIFTFGHIHKETNSTFNKNIDIIKKMFSNYISFKLSKLFISTLNRVNLFYFIKILVQRIKKNINEFIYIKLFDIKNENNNAYSNFFKTIWRHIKININQKNEICLLLKKNIPKFFKNIFSQNYIPYINNSQENNLVNTQLFLNNTDGLVNYIFYFLENDKKYNININKKTIIIHLNEYNLKNRNIFCLTRYIDSLYNDLINKKIKEFGENDNYNDENNYKENYYIQTEENNDTKNKDFLKSIKNNFEINRTNTYCIKKFRCKFIDYLNNK